MRMALILCSEHASAVKVLGEAAKAGEAHPQLRGRAVEEVEAPEDRRLELRFHTNNTEYSLHTVR